MTAPRCVLVAAAIGALACDDSRPRAGTESARQTSCDSSRAARVALDSLARLDSFPSAVLRFEHDSAGMRIVTWPDRQAGAAVLDGMAVIRVTSSCRIVSLVQTDSA